MTFRSQLFHSPVATRLPQARCLSPETIVRSGRPLASHDMLDQNVAWTSDRDREAQSIAAEMDRGGSVCLHRLAGLLSGSSAGFMPLREAAG